METPGATNKFSLASLHENPSKLQYSPDLRVKTSSKYDQSNYNGTFTPNYAEETSSSHSSQYPAASPQSTKHYSKNLYTLIDDGFGARKRLSRTTFGSFDPILQSLSGTEKMIITKQALRTCRRSRMTREVRLTVENADENLDSDDPFQAEGFSLNIENPQAIEFNLQTYNEFDTEEEQRQYTGRFAENLEEDFNDKEFDITLTEDKRRRVVGHVKMIDNSYHVFDANEGYIFQVERIAHPAGQGRIVFIKRKEGEVDVEMGWMDLGPWRSLTLETEVKFSGICSPKEKLMILGMALVLIIKIAPRGRVLRDGERGGVCSIGGLWKQALRKVKSIF